MLHGLNPRLLRFHRLDFSRNLRPDRLLGFYPRLMLLRPDRLLHGLNPRLLRLGLLCGRRRFSCGRRLRSGLGRMLLRQTER